MDEDSRIRRALNNPSIMIVLCLIAGFAVYENVVESAIDPSVPIPLTSTPLQSDSLSTNFGTTPKGHDKTAIRWNDHPTRDPFAPLTLVKHSKLPDPSNQIIKSRIQKSPKSNFKNLELKAVAIETEQRSAVINRQVVYEGESIAGYQVVGIDLNGVWLQRHGKKKFLTFENNSNSS